MLRRGSALLSLLVASLLVVQARAAPAVVDLELEVDGNMFTVNGAEKFLVFVSYFDGLDVSAANLEDDFEYLKGKGVDGVRVLVNWWTQPVDTWGTSNLNRTYAQDTLIAPNGTLRSARLTKLKSLLATAKAEGLLVDITLSAESVANCPTDDCEAFDPDIGSLTLAELTDAVEELTTELYQGSTYKHVLFDLQNEYDQLGYQGEDEFENSEIAALANAVRAIDSDRIVTASQASDVLSSTADNNADAADLDVVAWHERRVDNYWNFTTTDVHNLDNAGIPVYLQEPERLRPSNSIEEDEWLGPDGWALNVRNAITAGAAAWTFHNGGSFYMNGSRLENKLRPIEKDFLDCLAEAKSSGTCSTYPVPDPASSILSILLPERFRR